MAQQEIIVSVKLKDARGDIHQISNVQFPCVDGEVIEISSERSGLSATVTVPNISTHTVGVMQTETVKSEKCSSRWL